MTAPQHLFLVYTVYKLGHNNVNVLAVTAQERTENCEMMPPGLGVAGCEGVASVAGGFGGAIHLIHQLHAQGRQHKTHVHNQQPHQFVLRGTACIGGVFHIGFQ